jgi:type I restriction enzyme S subunit
MHSREYQAAVASFLNRECERINELLLAKKHLAALGRIAQGEGVRAELDTDAGALPPQKLGWHVEVLAGHAFPSEGFTDDPSAVRLLRGINVGVGRTDWSESVGWVADDVEPYRRWLLQAGDLVLGLDRPWIAGGIRVAELTHGDLPALLLQRVACLRPFSDCLMSAYVRLWLEHERFFADLGSMMTGVSVPHISPGQVGGFRLPVPDLARQQSVVRRASDAQASVARMETELGSLGSSLDEYRDALITEAVTGKLDVARLSERQMDESAHVAMEGERPEVLSA